MTDENIETLQSKTKLILAKSTQNQKKKAENFIQHSPRDPLNTGRHRATLLALKYI